MISGSVTASALAILVLALATPPDHSFAAEFHSGKLNFEGRSVAYNSSDAGESKPVVILLHGASGPALHLYQDQARAFSDKGYATIVLHYFDATRSSEATTENYRTWARLVEAMVTRIAQASAPKPRPVFLVGYSLGASVALAAGSQGVAVTAIAEWYGSLPDDFFYTMKGMPPLLVLHGERDTNIPIANAQQLLRLCGMKHLICESHIYPDQGHGFGGRSLDDADRRTVEFLAKYAAAP